MRAHVSFDGGHIEAVYACVHAPGAGCACRKPGIELFTRAAADLGIDLEQSVMVGDSLTDVQAARTAGCLPILAGRPAPADPPADLIVVADLAQAVDRIVSLSSRTAVGGRWGADRLAAVGNC
jgi:D-glycero-D-manno-heptose 1,7-bisphosphate phosphatase